MYESFYRFSANPFKLAPDSKFCFSHPCYDEARAYLEFAFKLGEGFVIFTGRPGTGKTTLVQSFLGSLDSTQAIAARVAVSNLNAADLLRAVAYAFDIDIEDMDMASVLRRLEKYFVQQVRSGKRILLIIDEAQGLSHSALEELRMLADLQIDSRFLLQVFLVGQESLRELMIVPEMEQFQQRVTGTCKLVPLSERETRGYVEYRLCQVDWSGDPELTGAAVHAIFQFSEGIPRHINKLCTRLLLHGLLEGKHVLDDADVLDVAEGLKDEQLAPLQADHALLDTSTQVRQAAMHAEQAEGAYAALALRAPKTADQGSCVDVKPERRTNVERQAKITHGSESRAVGRREEKAHDLSKVVDTETYRQGMTGVLTVSGYLKRYLDSTAVLGMLAVVTLLLIRIVINNNDLSESSNLRVSRVDPYETRVQLSRYRDGEYEEYIAYEEPDFVRENRTLQSARPADREVVATANEPNLDNTASEIAAIEVFKFPGVDAMLVSAQPEFLRRTTFADEQADTAVAETGTIDMLVDDNIGDEGPINQVQADIADPVANAEAKIDTVVPDAQPEQAATENVRQEEIRRLLSLARRSLREYRLLLPEDDNAYDYYQQVEALDPGNREAAKGIQKITEQYATLAERALKHDDETSAGRYINRGLRVHPGDGKLLALKVAMLESEAESRRVYEPPVTLRQPPRAPIAERVYEPPVILRQPPPAPTTLLSRIIELMDKNKEDIKESSIWHDEDNLE